ncbi:MAG: hypothetical protein HYY84_09405 [Deltaproteobacteria bacterium]|nr:hypothetical protein [Deltaproteobacteria bacterium]
MRKTITYKRITALILPVALYGCAQSHDMSGGSESTDVTYSQSNLESGNVPETDSTTPTTGDSEDDADANANPDADPNASDDGDHAGHEETVPQPTCGMPKHVLVQILWGNMPGGATPTASTDWTGTFAGSNGAVAKPVRAIRFESEDAMTGEFEGGFGWKSSTKPAMDGVLAVVGLPPPPSPEISPVPTPTVTFTTAPLTVSFQADELVRLNQVYKVDDQGNVVSFRAIPLGRCPHGFLRGHWTRIDAKGGIFRGQWSGPMGRVRGFVEGIWGQRASGKKVFVGRFISLSGKIRGKVAGHYEDGVYRGVWTRNGKVRGVLRGHYAEAPALSTDASVEANRPRGFFGGEWLKFCSKYRRCEATVSSGSSSDDVNSNDMAIEEFASEATSTTCAAQ